MPTHLPPSVINWYRKALTEYVATKRYEVLIRSYPKDEYPDISPDDWVDRHTRGIYWYRTEILTVMAGGLNLVASSTGCVTYLDYSWIRRLNMDGDRYYGEPHIFVQPAPEFFCPIGHAKGVDTPGSPDASQLVRDHGEMEKDRLGQLPDFHGFDEGALRSLGFPKPRMRWMSNAEAYTLQVPWRYVTALHGDIEYRVKDLADQVLVAIGGKATGMARANPTRPKPIRPAFFKQGQFWTVRYRTTEVHMRDSRGMDIIAILLAHQSKPVRLEDLDHGFAVPATPGTEGEEPQTAELGLDLTDPQTISECRTNRKELLKRFQRAAAASNIDEMAGIKLELTKLDEYLASTTTRFGTPRKSHDPRKKMQDRISKGLTRAMVSIKGVHLPLWKHLRSNIQNQTGSEYVYAPETPIDWEL